MSFILGVLKRSKREREKTAGPDDASRTGDDRPGRRRIWIWIAGAALFLNALNLTAFLMLPSGEQPAVEISLPPTGPERGPPQPPNPSVPGPAGIRPVPAVAAPTPSTPTAKASEGPEIACNAEDEKTAPARTTAVPEDGGREASAYTRRSQALVRESLYDCAVEEYGEAIRIAPDHGDARFSREILRFYSGQPKLAEEDISAILEGGGSRRAYALLWLYLSRAWVGGKSDRELQTYAGRLTLDPWPGIIGKLYMGQVPMS